MGVAQVPVQVEGAGEVAVVAEAAIKAWFLESPKEDVRLTNSNFTIVIKDEMAFAAYDSDLLDKSDKTTRLREFRTLLRIGGQWKVLAVQAYANHLSGK